MKRLLTLCSVLILCLSAWGRSGEKPLRLLYWNIQNGMWSGQEDNYDAFVGWVKDKKPDICVWCEAQSIYYTGTDRRLPAEETGNLLRAGTDTNMCTSAPTGTAIPR